MKQKILLTMSLLSMLLGCGNKLNDPDFEHQENKVIVLNNDFRIDYQIPGNLSQFMGFSEKHKKQPKSLDIENISNLEFTKQDWRNSKILDVGKWEYYRGKQHKEKNIIADLNMNIDIHKSTTDNLSLLETILINKYDEYLNGENGINTEAREDHPDYSDEELAGLIAKNPTFNKININSINYLHWKTYGEIRGWNIEHYITPIDNNHYLAIYFRYNFSAKNEKEFKTIETMLNHDIDKFMSQIKISKL